MWQSQIPVKILNTCSLEIGKLILRPMWTSQRPRKKNTHDKLKKMVRGLTG